MKILYLHGLREQGSKILDFLKPHKVIAPYLDPWKPSETLRAISELQEVDYIIGFSLGGFFGSCIKTSTPKLLINPALCFPDILKSRRNQSPKLIEEYMGLRPWANSNVKAIFTTEDHRIGLRSLPLYLEIYPESLVTYLPGGHTPGDDIKDIIIDLLK